MSEANIKATLLASSPEFQNLTCLYTADSTGLPEYVVTVRQQDATVEAMASEGITILGRLIAKHHGPTLTDRTKQLLLLLHGPTITELPAQGDAPAGVEFLIRIGLNINGVRTALPIEDRTMRVRSRKAKK